MKTKQSEKVELAKDLIKDWGNGEISGDGAMNAMAIIFLPQPKLTKKDIAFGKELSKRILTEKTLVKGKNCEFLLDPQDYPGLTFAIPSGMIEDRPSVKIPELPPTIQGHCPKITKKEARKFFKSQNRKEKI
jgi:hypothetical protein